MKRIAFRAIGFGIIHLILCAMYFLGEEVFGDTRLFPFVMPTIMFGPLLFGLELYFRQLKRAK